MRDTVLAERRLSDGCGANWPLGELVRVIASCDTTTARGLLLARLALCAGDVANLDLHDIDWDNALIHVAGKTRRTVALPLPQDAGDALLAYIEHARKPSIQAESSSE